MEPQSMEIDIITLFPSMFQGPLDESIIKRARDNGFLKLRLVDLRDFTHDKHRTVDDRPFGGGPGMLLKPEPLFDAVESLRRENSRTLLMGPCGTPYRQEKARSLSQEQHLIIICASYEGVDERVREFLIDEEISIGDYVLTNGALPAMVIVDSVTRLLPGVLGHEESPVDESFSDGLLEHPQYTRPADFRGMKAPDILFSGHHAEIAKWRRQQAEKRTASLRPDLLQPDTSKTGE
jgi:tRNA (guanine37-N1)-methyltransferase